MKESFTARLKLHAFFRPLVNPCPIFLACRKAVFALVALAVFATLQAHLFMQIFGLFFMLPEFC